MASAEAEPKPELAYARVVYVETSAWLLSTADINTHNQRAKRERLDPPPPGPVRIWLRERADGLQRLGDRLAFWRRIGDVQPSDEAPTDPDDRTGRDDDVDDDGRNDDGNPTLLRQRDDDRDGHDTVGMLLRLDVKSRLQSLYHELMASSGVGSDLAWFHDAGPDERRPTTTPEWNETWRPQTADDVSREWCRIWRDHTPGEEDRNAVFKPTLRHRIYIDADRAAKLFPVPANRPYRVVLDFHFFRLFSKLRCHLSISVWSHRPAHPVHCPGDSKGIPTSPIRDHELVEVRELFRRVAKEAWKLVDRHLVPYLERSKDGRLPLPQFWAVVPATQAKDPMRYLEGGPRLESTNLLVRELLDAGDARENTVASTVVGGNIAVLRHLRQQKGIEDIPTYVMILGASETAESVEWDAAKTITNLTDLEAEASHLLFNTQAQMAILRNHFDVYNAEVERGNFLWDALSTHFPVRRFVRLTKAHRGAQLLHQILLQAVADLDHMSALIRRRTFDIEETADLLARDFDRQITERPRKGSSGLRVALIETGLFAQARRKAKEDFDEAMRVKTSYDDVLKAIGNAFDERRVRSYDRVQATSAIFGVGIAVGALAIDAVRTFIATHFKTVVNPLLAGAKPALDWLDSVRTTDWVQAKEYSHAPMILGGVGLVVLFFAGWALLRVFTAGPLASRRFRKVYAGRRLRQWFRFTVRSPLQKALRKGWRAPTNVWRFLMDTSTDSLDRLSRIKGVHWDRLDRSLAAEFAECWDDARHRTPGSRSYRAGRDIRLVCKEIERWGLHSLLMTERARRMYRYRLPNLTCLYRCCSEIEGSFLKLSYVTTTQVVADVDLDRSLERLGFNYMQRQKIAGWLDQGPHNSARTALQRVGTLKLAGEMSAARRLDTLAVVAIDSSSAGATGRLRQAARSDEEAPTEPLSRVDG